MSIRSDARRNRDLLAAAVGRLLADERADFSLPELASEAGTSVATAYRHFKTPTDALSAFHTNAVHELTEALRAVSATQPPETWIDSYCAEWVLQAQKWGSATRFLRSHQGFLERLDADDVAITGLYTVLAGALKHHDRELSTSALRYRTLVWITLFDERVIYDLLSTQNWSVAATTNELTHTLRRALTLD